MEVDVDSRLACYIRFCHESVSSNIDLSDKKFYETVFGFNSVFFDSSFYLHLVSPGSGVQLGFLMPAHASQPEFLHPLMSPDGYVISLEVKDADHAYTEAKRMNVAVSMELKEEVWGQVHFMLQDPAGFKVDVVQQIEASGH